MGFSAFSLYAQNVMVWTHFTFNYTFLTVGLLCIFACYIAMNRRGSDGCEQVLKIVAFVNLWGYCAYVMLRYIPIHFNGDLIGFKAFAIFALVTFAIAFLYIKITVWSDNATRILASVMHITTMCGLFVSIMYLSVGHSYDGTLVGIFVFKLIAVFIGFGLFVYFYLIENKSEWTAVLKNINLIFLLLSCLFAFYALLGDFFGTHMILIIFTFVFAFVITKISAISDGGTRVLAIIINITALVWLGIFNMFEYGNIWGLILLNGVAQIIALFAINSIFNNIKGAGVSLKILIMSSYFLIAVTQGMMVQADVSFNSGVISLKYASAAFAWIVIGFVIKKKPVRKAGLFLSMLAAAKLLVVDTWGLSTEMRIVSYVSLGLILILISFVYQRLNRDAGDE